MDALDFPLILLVATAVTGALWCANMFYAKKRRPSGAPNPFWVEWGASFFPVILVVFGLRSFVIEPFKIPSGSMIPTLLVGDYVFVSKFSYGLRLPVWNTQIMETGKPQRGDVMVFRYPLDPSQNYIKRVVGLPGDKVEYLNKRLTINGQVIATREDTPFLHPGQMRYTPRFQEKLGEREHAILNEPQVLPDQIRAQGFTKDREACEYNTQGVICTVPRGRYFVLGDNRDASADSRVWGFVPEENIVGKAFFIWLNFNDMSRIGRFY